MNKSGGPYRNVVIEFIGQPPPDKWEYLPPRYTYGNTSETNAESSADISES